MVRTLYLTLACLCCVFPSFSQKKALEKVTGVVKTTDGHEVDLISVSLKNTTYGAVTDENGYFSFSAPAGEYTMQVYSIFAHRKEFPVVIKAGIVNHFPDITVIENKNQLDEVVVTGQFSPQSMRNSLYKVKVINSESIQKKAAVNVQSLLNTEIGVRLSNDMSLGETDFELMGMSGNNVKVLIDGVPMIDRGSNKQSLSQIDINTIEKIELVEGPMSVTYGTDALAGVINIITKKPSPGSGKNTYSISANLQEETVGDEYAFGSGDGIHNQSVQAGFGHHNGLYVNGGYSHKTTNGWKGGKTGRERMWQPKDQDLFNGTIGYNNKKGLNIWYRLDYLDEEIKTPLNGSDLTPYEVTDRNYITNRYTHQLQSDWKLNNRLTLNFAASYQDYERFTRTIITNEETGDRWLSVAESAQDTTTMDSWFARATASWRINSKLSVQPGIEFREMNAAGDRIDGDPSMTDLAVFLSAEWKPLGWLDIRPGIRTIPVSDYEAPTAIPSLLTKFALNGDMDLRVSYAYGFRAPTLREMYMSFHNANHNIDGNPDLKAEYSNNFTASYTWRILHNEDIRLTSTLSGFYNDFKDRIVIATDENDPTHNIYDNVDKYKTTGGSLENAIAWKDLQANVNFSLVGRYNSYSDDSSLEGEDLPTFRFSPELSASVTYKLSKTNTDFNLFYKFTGARKEYRQNSDTKEMYLGGVDSYNWADLTITQKLFDYVSVNAGIKNIFDITLVNNDSGGSGHTSSGSSVLIGSGRSYFLGLVFHLNK